MKPVNKTVRVHTCFNQHLGEELPENCRCSKELPFDEAERLVSQGRADWLILSRTPITLEEAKTRSPERGRLNPSLKELDDEKGDRGLKVCPICFKKDASKKQKCKNCHGKGYEEPQIFWEELSRYQQPYPGGAIVMSTQADEKKRYGLAKMQKTPRVATLEGPSPKAGPGRLGHIVRAAIGKKYDQERIDAYGKINFMELYGYPKGISVEAALKLSLAELRKKVELSLEPEDVAGDRTHDAQGREYDWGTSILS